jgi:hypothetical protein
MRVCVSATHQLIHVLRQPRARHDRQRAFRIGQRERSLRCYSGSGELAQNLDVLRPSLDVLEPHHGLRTSDLLAAGAHRRVEPRHCAAVVDVLRERSARNRTCVRHTAACTGEMQSTTCPCSASATTTSCGIAAQA